MPAANKKVNPPTATVYFRIEVEVGMELGALTLEAALEKARAMSVTDVLDLTGLEYNDGSIQVSSVYTALPYIKS